MQIQDPVLTQELIAQYFAARRTDYVNAPAPANGQQFDLGERLIRALNHARGGGEVADIVNNLPIKRTPFIKTSFVLLSDMTKVDVVDNLCSISGRVYSHNFETEPPIENKWRFTAENRDMGIKIEVQFYNLQEQVSEDVHKIMCEIKLVSGRKSIFYEFYHQFIK